jgi:hypothetical protein
MAARKFDQNRLDQLVEAAKASERPYAALEGKPFNLSASVARTLVVGSGLSKSAPEIVIREKARIARWLEQGDVGAKPKAAKSEPADVPEAIEVPDAVKAALDANAVAAEKHRRAPRSRAPRKTGEASGTAKEIAANRAEAARHDG